VFLAGNVQAVGQRVRLSGAADRARGEPVTDAFYFAHQPLRETARSQADDSRDGQVAAGPSQTAQACSRVQGGAPPQGSSSSRARRRARPYAAMMVTAAHGVRMHGTTSTTARPEGRVSAASAALAAAGPRRRHDPPAKEPPTDAMALARHRALTRADLPPCKPLKQGPCHGHRRASLSAGQLLREERNS